MEWHSRQIGAKFLQFSIGSLHSPTANVQPESEFWNSFVHVVGGLVAGARERVTERSERPVQSDTLHFAQSGRNFVKR